MEAFFNGPYFWPVVVGLLLLLFVVVIWTAIGSKKHEKKLEQETNNKPVEEVVTTTPTTKDIEEVKKEIEAKQNAIEKEEIEIPQPIAEENVQETPVVERRTEVAPDAPKIEIPINEMDESQVTVEKASEAVVEEKEPQVEVPETKTLVETEQVGERIELEFSKPLDASLDIGEKIVVPKSEEVVETPEETIEVEKTTQLVEEQEEQVEVPIAKEVEVPVTKEVEMPEVNDAFSTTPSEDTSINEDIIVEEPHEYTSNKTEVFEFPDFSDIPGGEEEKEEYDIDKEIIKTAEEYVSSVMHR